MSRKTSGRKLSLHNLFYNNKFVLFFSFLAAIAIWAVITVTQAPIVEQDIANIAVTIDMGDNSQPQRLGLQPFGVTDMRVNVRVRGKRYEVRSLSENDIVVTADTSGVGAAGTHTLRLRAACENGNVELVSISQSSVDVYFDAYKEQTFTLVPEIVAPNGVVPEGYTYTQSDLSTQSIVISGPAAELNKIERVVASVEISSPLTATPSAPLVATVTPETTTGDAPRYVTIKDSGDVTMSIQVLKVRTLPTAVSFAGAPSAYAASPLSYEVLPANVTVAGAPDTIDSLTSFIVGTVDFSSIGESGGTFYFRASDISGFRVMDDVDTFQVNVHASNMGSTTVTIPAGSIRLQNVPTGFSASLEQLELQVTVVGTREEIASLSSAQVSASVDLSNVTAQEGVYDVPAIISISGKTTCWAYSTYTLNVRLTPAQ